MFCECGEEIKDKNARFCSECGAELTKLNPITGKFEKIDKYNKNWIKNLSYIIGGWGIINLFLSPFGGDGGPILIFFAILIYASRSRNAVYAFGVIWMIVAFIQLLYGLYYPNLVWYILLAIINFAFAGWVINTARTQPEQPSQTNKINFNLKR